MIDIIIQIFIFVFGVSAIFMSQSKNINIRKWACIVGLTGQPFWIYSTFINAQWGIFLVSFFYTLAWFKGIKTYWIINNKGQKQMAKTNDDIRRELLSDIISDIKDLHNVSFDPKIFDITCETPSEEIMSYIKINLYKDKK